MIKKLLTLGIALLMLFSLAACSNNLAEYKESAKEEIENFAVAEDYSIVNWTVVLGHINDGKTAVDVATTKLLVDTAVIKAKNAINAILTKEQEMADFILTIKVDNTILSQGDDIQVEIIFKNNTGKVLEISHSSSWIMPFIAEWYETGVIDINISTIEADETIVRTPKIGSILPKGEYILVAKAVFSVLQFESDRIIASQKYSVESKAIILTVV